MSLKRLGVVGVVGVLACLVFGWLVVSVPQAFAHAELVSTSPADRSVLPQEPGRVTLLFSEGVSVRLSTVRVIGPDGRRLDRGAARAVAPGAERIAVDLVPDPGQGTFVVVWRATAADDGHATSGTLTFAVGSPGPLPNAEGVGASDRVSGLVLDAATWSGFAGLALLVGHAVIRVCDGPRAGGSTAGWTPRWQAGLGWAVLLGATLVQLLVYGPASQGMSPGRMVDRTLLAATLSTREGHLLVVRLLLLALVAAVGEALLRRRRGAAVVAVLVVGLAGTWAGAGHASTGPDVPLALTATTLHVTAFAVWAGGLTGLAALPRDEDGGRLRIVSGRFSQVALGAVAVLAATGGYQAWREIGGLGEVTGTPYGRLLLVKSAVVALLLVVAAVSRRIVRCEDDRTGGNRAPVPAARLRRSVRGELVGVTAVLVVTVLLIGQAPPHH